MGTKSQRGGREKKVILDRGAGSLEVGKFLYHPLYLVLVIYDYFYMTWLSSAHFFIPSFNAVHFLPAKLKRPEISTPESDGSMFAKGP